MKSTDLIKKLPTPAELLENPRVRSVVDRLNPTVVTARVRGFLDEVRGELAHRAEEAGLPTLSELAERVSRYLTGGAQRDLGGAINATGRLRGGPWVSTPLADAALEQMLMMAQDFTVSLDGSPADADAARRLCELTGAEAALVLNSHHAAIELALRTLPDPRRVVVARGEVTTIDPGCRLTDLAAAAGATLVEVGAADGVSLDDYRGALDGGAPLLRLAGAGRSDDSQCRPSLDQLAQAARACGSPMLVELNGAALREVEGLGELIAPTVAAAVELGAELVLVRGDGLLGGPACGVVLGAKQAVERMQSWPLTAWMRLDPLRAAALSATLRLHADSNQACLAIPALSLCTTPLENLRTRAERLAPQIAESPLVERAEPVELADAVIAGAPIKSPSWGIRIWPAASTVEALASVLRGGSLGIVGVAQQQSLLLDLRTVFPRQDLAMIAAFEGAGPADPAEQSAPDSAE